MIKLLFKKGGKYFSFIIDNRTIVGVMGSYRLPYQPPNLAEVNKQILLSRNKLPAWFGKLFEITKEEQKEYDCAKDDNALKEIIVHDAKKEGAELINEKN